MFFYFALLSPDISAMHALPVPAAAINTQVNKKRPIANQKPNHPKQATVSTSDSQSDGMEPVVIRAQFLYCFKVVVIIFMQTARLITEVSSLLIELDGYIFLRVMKEKMKKSD